MAQDRLESSFAITASFPDNRSRLLLIPWMIVALGALYYCYEYFLRISPSIMTHELMREYHLTATEVGNLSACYYHAYVPMQILVGLLMDRYGPRRLLTAACLFCAIGTYLFAAGYNLQVAEIGRLCVGFGSAFAFVGALKLATIWLPPHRFAFISGAITCLGMLGAMTGDIVLRVLVDMLGWQVTIYASAFVGVILAFIIWIVVRDMNPVSRTYHADSLCFHGLIIGLLSALKNPHIWLNGLIGFLLYLSLSAFAELWGISYLEQARGLSKTHAAYANSLIFLGWAIGAPLWGWFSDFIRLRRLPILIGSIFAFIVLSFLIYMPYLTVTEIDLLSFSFGLMCSAQVIVFAVCREVTSVRMAGTAIALTNMFVMIGGNFFQPIVGRLLDVKWMGTFSEGVRTYSPAAYQYALSILPFSILLTIIALFFIRETYGRAVINSD